MARTIELTRIMVLSPIFLALGAVATSVLNARGRFAASAIAPIVYNLAIIGGRCSGPDASVPRGSPSASCSGRSATSSSSPRRSGRSASATSRGSTLADPAARKALTLMAPRAVGLGAGQITFVVVTSLATTLGVGAMTAFNVAFTLLQIPIGVIGVPLGIVVLPVAVARGRRPATSRSSSASLTRALRLLVVAMLPVGGLLAASPGEVVTLLFGHA